MYLFLYFCLESQTPCPEQGLLICCLAVGQSQGTVTAAPAPGPVGLCVGAGI